MSVQESSPAESTTAASVEERLLSRMKQRTIEIAERSERRRNEQPNRNTELETADSFLTAFSEMKAKLEVDLAKCNQLDQSESKDTKLALFDRLVRDHGLMQQFLNESSMFLAAFQLKRSQETLADLNAEIQLKMQASQPKKRFGFKSKTEPKHKIGKASLDRAELDEADSKQTEAKHTALDALLAKNYFGFKNRTNEQLVMEASTIHNRQLNLHNLTGCTVIVLGSPSTVQAASLTKCTVVLGPTSRSVFIKDCRDCFLALACQQLRIHDTCDTQFYLHVTGAAIIESCRNVGFAPYSLTYPQLDKHYALSGLDRDTNNWDKVEDFKWISENEKSPNMYSIEENKRKIDWL